MNTTNRPANTFKLCPTDRSPGGSLVHGFTVHIQYSSGASFLTRKGGNSGNLRDSWFQTAERARRFMAEKFPNLSEYIGT